MGWGLELARRALELVGRVSEQAKRALESAGRPGALWKDQLGARGGRRQTDRQKEREKEQSVTSMWWYHRSSSPTGPLPKKEKQGQEKHSKEKVTRCAMDWTRMHMRIVR